MYNRHQTIIGVFSMLCVLLLGVLGKTAPVQAQTPSAQTERLTGFHSDIRIQRDGSMIVTETITAIAQGLRIRRGIYRDIPLRYKTDSGKQLIVGFKVLGVTRNGKKEAWHTAGRGNGIRVYIGDADINIPKGRHTYKLTYRTDRQLGFFKEFDELYWNVNGRGWEFIIEQVSATVHLPNGARATKSTAYIGRFGKRGTAWRKETLTDGATRIESTRPVRPGETLTIVVQFPKAIVAPPTPAQRREWYFRDHGGFIVAALGLLILSIYYLIAWFLVGRDPRKGAIIPRFHPPKNVSPAATRFVRRMGFDDGCMTAAIVSLAIKGYLKISQSKSKTFTLSKIEGTPSGEATAGEEKVFDMLLGTRKKIRLVSKNHSYFGSAKSGLEEILKQEYQDANFRHNRLFMILGVLITIAVAVVLPFVAPGDSGGVLTVLMIFLPIALLLAGRAIVAIRRRGFSSALPQIIPAVMLGLMATFVIVGLQDEIDMLTLLVVVGFALVNAVFFHLIKAPTRAGRKLMDEIDGLEMYMTVAEKDRLNALHPPDQTPEEFERLLPYALALGVENKWAERFQSVLAAAQAGSSRTYDPLWYSGLRATEFSAATFSSSLGDSLSRSVASASTAPGSSSGGSSGGFSGGGGGGGGGGGW